MTQQDDITQRVLTAEHHLNELMRLTQPWPNATIPCATVRSHVEQALSKLRAPVADEPVPYPKREDVTPEMRASFERLFSEARKHNHGTLARNEQGAYRDLRVDADWVFYQRAWADALASAPVADERAARLDAECNSLAHQLNASNERNGVLRAALSDCSAELFAQCGDQPRAMSYVNAARAALASAPVAGERALPPLPEVMMRTDWLRGYADTAEMQAKSYSHGTMYSIAKALREIAGWCDARVALASVPVAITELRIEFTAGGVGYVSIESARAAVLAASRGAPVAGEAQERIEQMAVNRYRPVPDGKFSYKVVAGDGSRSLYTGTKDSCLRVAAKLTEAFLDGAFVASDAAPQASAEDVRNAALEEAYEAVACLYAAYYQHSKRSESDDILQALKQAGDDIRALKQPQADKDGGQQRAGDAERWRWATATDENAQMLYTIVQAYGGDQQKINERADFYRAVHAAAQAEQGERDA